MNIPNRTDKSDYFVFGLSILLLGGILAIHFTTPLYRVYVLDIGPHIPGRRYLDSELRTPLTAIIAFTELLLDEETCHIKPCPKGLSPGN